MTDKEKLTDLFNEFGIELRDHGYCGDIEENKLFLVEGHTEKIKGYSGFFTHFEFDDEGKFIECGIWE